MQYACSQCAMMIEILLAATAKLPGASSGGWSGGLVVGGSKKETGTLNSEYFGIVVALKEATCLAAASVRLVWCPDDCAESRGDGFRRH